MDLLSRPGSPRREVHCADALAWMRTWGGVAGGAVVTSLPDVSEMRMPLPAWRAWFLDAVKQAVEVVPATGAALFFQSDIKREGRWIDKGAMVVRAAEDAGAHVLFHKIICRRPPGLLTYGRPGYTHLIAVSRALRCPEALPIPDLVVDAGRLPWVRAMGIRAAAHAIRFARDHAGATTIVDPFCGVGTVLAVANQLGLSSIGVDRSVKRCAEARLLKVMDHEL